MRLKITSGHLKGRYIAVPQTGLRPTEEKVRSAYFDILFSLINFEDRTFLDVFSGSGAMSFESISRGLEKAYAVERDRKAVDRIRSSIDSLELSKVKVFRGDAYKPDTYKGLEKVNAVYIDPPYAQRDKLPDLLDMLEMLNLFDDVCVLGVESDKALDWMRRGWSRKEKKYGSTVLTVLYNWE